MDIKNKIAIITGGCSGLGNATVHSFIEQGAKVAIFDINEEQGAAIVNKLGPENVMFKKVDVRSAQSVENAVASVVQNFGAVHVCVNCAGIGPAKRTLDRDGNAMPLDNFSNVIEINLIGTFNVARVAASAMSKNEPMGEAQERGIIINTSSVAGYEGQVGQAGYAASKGGILALNLPMARDLAPLGIRVNAIAPGTMGTPMLLNMPQNVQDSLVNDIQFPKRLGLPSEYGALAVHLAQNAYINGEAIRIDGALRMQAK
jgi:NAD(P)-dependent dehydrogenase (short-subunit alcohol dehydrogenase family)